MKTPISKGTRIRLRGFQPMSTMELYEGVCGMVIRIEQNENMGDVVFIRLADKTGKVIQTRRQFCEPI